MQGRQGAHSLLRIGRSLKRVSQDGSEVYICAGCITVDSNAVCDIGMVTQVRNVSRVLCAELGCAQ